ncbi:MAG: glycosyltransferase family 4 protein [Dehalococcoidia bacterium]|nr:glycosyltransferase family 4 protein [Dehalococcoidia bacterium]MDW8120268.1 glycosyltransferase family 4 protein [Chloroflexota bacterium]
MRLLVLTHHWLPNIGGLEIVAWEMARRLAHRGHQVTVVTSTVGLPRTGAIPFSSTQEGVHILRIPAWDGLERWWGIPYPLFAPSLVSTLRRLVPQYDLVLVHTHVFMSSVVGAWMARGYGKPLVVYQHTPFIRYPFPWGLMERGADAVLGRWPLRWAAAVVGVSRTVADYVQKERGRPVEAVIYPGVDTERFAPIASVEERKSLRRRLGLPEEAFIVLAVGRLTFKKGFDVLVEACTILRAQPDLQVLIVGDGPARPALVKRASEHGLTGLRFWGAAPMQTMSDLYRVADAFVLPSRTGEGFPLVILEAMASGLPVIATPLGGAREVVENGRTGFLVPPGDPEALAAVLSDLKQDPCLAPRLGAAARAQALSMDWERFTTRWEHLLTALVHRERF